MKKRILFLWTLFVFFSCKKGEDFSFASKESVDSIAYYYNKLQDERLPELEQKRMSLRVFDLIQQTDNSLENRKKLAKITFDFYYADNLKKFNQAAQFLETMAIDAQDSIHLGKAYRCRAIYYESKKKLDSSFYFFKRAEKIYAGLKDDETFNTILMNKGIIQFSLGEFLGAELSLSKAYTYFKKEENFIKQYSILNQLGLVATELQEYDRALLYHTQALNAVKQIPDFKKSTEIYYCYNNIGYLYIKQKKYKSAVQNIQYALSDVESVKKDPVIYAFLIDNLAYAQLHLKEYSGVLDKFTEALEIRKQFDNSTSVIGSYTHISEYYYRLNNKEKAIEYSNRAIFEARKSKIPNNILIALKQAQEVDKINLSVYNEEYIKLNDSLQLAERNSKDRLSRIEFETDEITKENDELAERNRFYLYGSLIFGVITTLLFILRAQRAKTRELAYKQEQQKANEEIFTLMMSQQTVIDEIRKEEKQRIARELHDGVLGRMFGVRLNLDSLGDKKDAATESKRHQYINELKDIEQDIREISHDLNREKQALVNNFVSIVNKLLEEQRNLHSATLKYHVDEKMTWERINNISKINLYRILQESLQNINKYAQAKSIFVELVKEDDAIVMIIEDDGIGFDVNKNNKGIGVQNMVSRIDECHGIIDITSIKGTGTKIYISIPIKENILKI